jgi:hypothetical protein
MCCFVVKHGGLISDGAAGSPVLAPFTTCSLVCNDHVVVEGHLQGWMTFQPGSNMVSTSGTEQYIKTIDHLFCKALF